MTSDSSNAEKPQTAVWWYDANSSRRRRAALMFGGGFACAKTEDGERRDARIKDLDVSSRLGAAPRRITFPDGVSLAADDNDFVDRMLKTGGSMRAVSFLHAVETKWRLIVLAAAGAVLAGAAVFLFAVPAAAKAAAKTMPHEYLAKITDEVYRQMQGEILRGGKLPPKETARLEKIFANTAAEYQESGHNYRLRLHDFFPNAFAFPDGLIVMSDKLAEVLTEDELRAVFAHEIGHVELRHGMQSVFQSAGIAAFLLLATGDLSGLALGGALLANLKYSRNHEREADCFAYRHLKRRGLSGALVGDALVKIKNAYKKSAEKPDGGAKPNEADEESGNGAETENGENGAKEKERGGKVWRKVLEALSTHPATEERRGLAAACEQ